MYPNYPNVYLGRNCVRIKRDSWKNRAHERVITLRYWDSLDRMAQVQMNPSKTLNDLTGSFNDRNYSVVSFAHGLVAAGFEVEIQRPHEQPSVFNPVAHLLTYPYFLIGLAWGCNRLDDMRRLMNRVDGRLRSEVWSATAKYYEMNRSRFRTEPLRLIII